MHAAFSSRRPTAPSINGQSIAQCALIYPKELTCAQQLTALTAARHAHIISSDGRRAKKLNVGAQQQDTWNLGGVTLGPRQTKNQPNKQQTYTPAKEKRRGQSAHRSWKRKNRRSPRTLLSHRREPPNPLQQHGPDVETDEGTLFLAPPPLLRQSKLLQMWEGVRQTCRGARRKMVARELQRAKLRQQQHHFFRKLGQCVAFEV